MQTTIKHPVNIYPIGTHSRVRGSIKQDNKITCYYRWNKTQIYMILLTQFFQFSNDKFVDY